ncbi:hypothetical protein [Campylobacter helveticus]|nr:hypothetical protein [Campylobacter helveticus]
MRKCGAKGIASALTGFAMTNLVSGYHATPIRRGSSVITSRLVGVVI